MLKLRTNQLVVWFASSCEYLMFITLPSPHPGALARPSTPQSVVSQVVCPNFLLFRCFHLRFTFESIKELGSVLIWVSSSILVVFDIYSSFYVQKMLILVMPYVVQAMVMVCRRSSS